ncbi:TetR/AcrR family transcriptional regulator [Virgibacillus necropolis]|uniref:TetR/AcrR family transcriptional regulator n=1 Tax=Virgibacillus necropolis TaxID=163877 RepID=UPI00384D356D
MNKKKKQIIDAAHQLFIEKGFALTSIQDILNKAHIAKGTFYNYFNSKNECLLAILEFVKEEVDQKRRELAQGKENDDEQVFVDQMAVRMNMNRQHHLLVVFESVSFSDDIELKAFMKEQHNKELRWITKRLEDIYPPTAKRYTLDHAVMLVGIVHHIMHVWKLGSTTEIETEKIIQYALARVKAMINEQIQSKEVFFPESWLTQAIDCDTIDVSETKRKTVEQLKSLAEKVGHEETKKTDYIQFVLTELQADEPRTFLLESILISLEHAFKHSTYDYEVRSISKMVWGIIDHIEENKH